MARGSYLRIIDNKNRVYLPKKIREKLAQNGVTELIRVPYGDYVCYYTHEGWTHQQQNLAALFDEAKRSELVQSAELVSLQSAGRVLIPKECDFGPEGSEVMLELFATFFKVSRPKKEQLTFGLPDFQFPEKIKTAFKPKKSELPLLKVPLEDIRLEDQTFLNRLDIDTEELMDSIREQGQLIPVILRGRKPYQVISGFRRLTALHRLEKTEALAMVYPILDDKKAHVLSLIENLQRKSLSDYEMIRALGLMREKGYSALELAGMIGKGRRIIEQYLRVWEGPESIKTALAQKNISLSAAFNAISKNLTVDEIQGKSIRQILQGEAQVLKRDTGAITFREFKNGRLSLHMKFDRKKHQLTEVISELEEIIDKLKEKKTEEEKTKDEKNDPSEPMDDLI